ncbi:MAG: hypothetical protein ABIT76_15605 [Chthoniobacterales bacterium]
MFPQIPPDVAAAKKTFPWCIALGLVLGWPALLIAADPTPEAMPSATVSSATGADKLPAWIPIYPGWTLTSDGGFHVKSGEDATGSIAGTTKDAVTKVSGYYKDTLEKAGFKCTETNTRVGAVEMSSVSAKNESLGQEITVSIQKDQARPDAQVTLVYQSKKP